MSLTARFVASFDGQPDRWKTYACNVRCDKEPIKQCNKCLINKWVCTIIIIPLFDFYHHIITEAFDNNNNKQTRNKIAVKWLFRLLKSLTWLDASAKTDKNIYTIKNSKRERDIASQKRKLNIINIPAWHTRILQKVLSLGSDYFRATFYQTYFYYTPSKYSPFTETHFCNLFT